MKSQRLRKLFLFATALSGSVWAMSIPFSVQRVGCNPSLHLGAGHIQVTGYLGPKAPIARALAFPIPYYSTFTPRWIMMMNDPVRYGDWLSTLRYSSGLMWPKVHVFPGLPGPCSTGPSPYAKSHTGVMVVLPLWLPFLCFAIPTILVGRSNARRKAPRFCRRCGYNLTGNVSGRCPECGSPVTRMDSEVKRR